MQIREFREGDAEDLRKIYLQSRATTFVWLDTSKFALTDFDKDTLGEQILVATKGNQILGFVAIWRPESFVHHLYVSPQFCGKGVGATLLNAVKERYTQFSLKCMTENVQAVNFYHSQGLIVEEEASDDFGEYYLMRYKSEE